MIHLDWKGREQRRPRGCLKTAFRGRAEADKASEFLSEVGATTSDRAAAVLNYDYSACHDAWELHAPKRSTKVIKQFAKLGVQLSYAPPTNHFRDKMNQGSAQIFLVGLERRLSTPPGELPLPVDSGADQGGARTANYQNDEYDRLYEKMRFTWRTARAQATIDRMVGSCAAFRHWLWGHNPYSDWDRTGRG
jgi:hypothetical protein